MSTNDYVSHRARLIGYLTQAGLSTPRANACLDALLASAPTDQPVSSPIRPQDVPHDLVMAGVRAVGAFSADSVREVLAAVLPLVTHQRSAEEKEAP